jgi:uncharacterized protein YndB with AHSA1/START domain
MNSTQTDRIEKKIVLKAPRSRVWQALTDSKQFGEWFGCEVEGPFIAGGTLTRASLTMREYKGRQMEFVVDRIEPESFFSWRWHPAAIDEGIDYASEPMTNVEFHLKEIAGGTELTVIETGFDQVPLARQATAYRMNIGGWEHQMDQIATYVGG